MITNRLKIKKTLTSVLNSVFLIATAIALASLVFDIGSFDTGDSAKETIKLLECFIAALFVIDLYIRWWLDRFSLEHLKDNWANFALILLFFILSLSVFRQTSRLYRTSNIDYIAIFKFYIIGSIFLRGISSWQKVARADLSPAFIVVISFVVIILTGTSLLMLPGAVSEYKYITIIDALFTSTSAVCVTGLTVVDTGSFFSRFGQIIILLLIQIGGLGPITIMAFFSLILGKSMSIRESIFMSDILSTRAMSRVPFLLFSILSLTIAFELLGALSLYIAWMNYGAFEWGSVTYYSIFHSISAFCNAGFSLFQDSFEEFVGNPIVNISITSLIVFGGMGFIVLINLINTFVLRRGKLMLHTKLVLSVTLSLILGGTLLFLVTEWSNSLDGLSLIDKILASYFQSVTTRTAGFNTINMGSLTYACYFFTMIFMFIGASPGSTGGGIKTSTLGVFLGSIWSMFRARKTVEMFKREISSAIVNDASLLAILASVIICIFGFALLTTQTSEPIQILFELFSAFGTVGLSTGITSQLTTLGKLLIIIVMFIGRAGPLTILFSVLVRQKRKTLQYEYPEEEIMIG